MCQLTGLQALQSKRPTIQFVRSFITRRNPNYWPIRSLTDRLVPLDFWRRLALSCRISSWTSRVRV